MLIDMNSVKGKCIGFGVVILIVVIMVIITGLTSPSDPGKWETPLNTSSAANSTEEEYAILAAIGQYASNRNSIGVDRTGHVKNKWGAG